MVVFAHFFYTILLDILTKQFTSVLYFICFFSLYFIVQKIMMSTNRKKSKRLSCETVRNDFTTFLVNQGIPIQMCERCQFPLVCTKQGLRVHPELLSPDCTWERLRSSLLTSFGNEVLEKHIDFLADGDFGRVYRIGNRNYVIKHQPIFVNNQPTDSSFLVNTSTTTTTTPATTPATVMNELKVVTREEHVPEQPRVAMIEQSCIIEPLAMYALNRCEDEYGSFIRGQTHCVPRIFFTALLFDGTTWHSFSFIEYLQNCLVFSEWENQQKMKNQILRIETMILKIKNMFEQMEASPVMLHHFDAHKGNLMVNSITNHLYLLDFGLVHFLMPLLFLCPVVKQHLKDISRFCVFDGHSSFVPFKIQNVYVRVFNFASFLVKSKYHRNVHDISHLVQSYTQEYSVLYKANSNNKQSTAFNYLLFRNFSNHLSTGSSSTDTIKDDESHDPTKCTFSGNSCIVRQNKQVQQIQRYSLMSDEERQTFQQIIQERILRPSEFIREFFDFVNDNKSLLEHLSLFVREYGSLIQETKSKVLADEYDDEHLFRTEWYELLENELSTRMVTNQIVQTQTAFSTTTTNGFIIASVFKVLETLKTIFDFEALMHDDLESYHAMYSAVKGVQSVTISNPVLINTFIQVVNKYRSIVNILLLYQYDENVESQEISLWSTLVDNEHQTPNLTFFSKVVQRNDLLDDLYQNCVLALQYKTYREWESEKSDH